MLLYVLFLLVVVVLLASRGSPRNWCGSIFSRNFSTRKRESAQSTSSPPTTHRHHCC